MKKTSTKSNSKAKSGKPKSSKLKMNLLQYLKNQKSPVANQLNVVILGDFLDQQRMKIADELVNVVGTKLFRSSFSSKEMKEFFVVTGDLSYFLVLSHNKKTLNRDHLGLFDESDYSWHRDQCGAISQYFKQVQAKQVILHFVECTEETRRGLIVGLSLALYQFKGFKLDQDIVNQVIHAKNWKLSERQLQNMDDSKKSKSLKISLSDFTGEEVNRVDIKKYSNESFAINVARHYVNTPPNFLNPHTFVVNSLRLIAEHLKEVSVSAPKYIQLELASIKNLHFKNRPSSTDEVFVEVWDQEKLKKENAGMILAVGQGSETPPYMMRVRYRSNDFTGKPIAIIGKGVTFDSGGYDIKPSSAMRLMKKDMGGAASVFGVCMWALLTRPSQHLDFYFGLAENMVDAKAFRPSDVITARNGMTVEIHNTDAEGRLVLGDVMDVAVTQVGNEEPQLIIDCATLTGACRVALGVEVAGLFSNDDRFCSMIQSAAQSAGDPVWRLPLYQKYTANFGSNYADIVNATDGMGGAITAALFLEKFVRNKPWIHLDMYAWADKPAGALTSAGGNGQGIQALIEMIKRIQTSSAS